MKMNLQLLLILLLSIGISSCGKKEEKNDNVRITQPSTPEDNATQDLLLAIDNNDTELALAAISRGADVNYTTSNGETLLTYTIAHDQRSMIKILLNAGAIIEKKNKAGDAPIHIASKLSNLSLLKLLLENGANINSLDISNHSSLHLAIMNRSEEMCFFLIRNNIDIYLVNKNGETALDTAKRLNFSSIFIYLTIKMQLDLGQANEDTLKLVIQNGHIEALNEVIKLAPHLITNPQKFDPLILAMEYSDHDIANKMLDVLMSNGAPLNGLKPSEIPIHFAIKKLNYDFVNFIASQGADLNNNNQNGENSVIVAVQNNHFEMVRLLRSRGGFKKYSATVNGKTKKFNACEIAREINRKLTDAEEKKINKKIRVELNCGWRIIFELFD
jgi:ankyrin repeat protein